MYSLHSVNMTPEIICSVVFGIVASVLALGTIIQAHRRHVINGVLFIPMAYKKYRTRTSQH